MSIHDFLKGKKILVFGLGVQGGGVGDALWLQKHNYDLRGTDQNNHSIPELNSIPLTLGRHEPADIDWADLIIKNPGVPDDHPLIEYARKSGKAVYSSIALFVKYCPIKTIGITGTRGKSTTTAITTEVLNAAYPNQIVTGGNIPGTSSFQLFDQLEGKKYVVLELSSFQLHSFHDLKVSPNYSIFTNLYPDHLNRYPSMAEYQHDKDAIWMYQKEDDICVKSADPAIVAEWDTPLPGIHNKENISNMWALVSHLNVSESLTREVVSKFIGIPFRQEKIRQVNGVTYINDTTATTPVAAAKALQAQTSLTILICGGATKNLPLDVFLEEIKTNQHLKQIILLGSHSIPEFTSPLSSFASSKIAGQVESMAEAVALAHSLAKPGEVVLLSPGFASFDLFQNEFDRGRQFNNCVNQLK